MQHLSMSSVDKSLLLNFCLTDVFVFLLSDKVSWIAASVTVKAKTTAETDGESTGQSDAEVSEWEEDITGAIANGTAHKVLFFGLKSNKVLASSGISAKINSMVFTHDSTAFAKLLLVTESSELLQITSSENDSANVSNGQAGVQMAKVAGTKLPSLSATNLEFDANSEMAIVAQEKLGNVRNPVHANKVCYYVHKMNCYVLCIALCILCCVTDIIAPRETARCRNHNNR